MCIQNIFSKEHVLLFLSCITIYLKSLKIKECSIYTDIIQQAIILR